MKIFMFTGIIASLLLYCGQLPNGFSGGGIETGNIKSAGIAVNERGIPVEGAQVIVAQDIWTKNRIVEFETRTDANGYYCLDSLTIGSYKLQVISPNLSVAFSRDIKCLRDGDSIFNGIDTLKQLSHVRGKVALYDNRTPEGITVGLRGTRYSQVVASDGNFDFRNIPEGTYVVVVDATKKGIDIPHLASISLPSDTLINITVPDFKKLTMSMYKGQTWAYCNYMEDYSKDGLQNNPDKKPHQFQNLLCITDSIEGSVRVLNIDITEYVKWSAFPVVESSRSGLRVEISDVLLRVYNKKNSTHIIPSLFKSSSQKKVENSKLLFTAQYDTSQFGDRITPFLFTAWPNRVWYGRSPNDPTGSYPLVYRFTGTETVKVPAGTFNCMRVEWEWTASYDNETDSNFSPVDGINYISDIGNIKRVISSKKGFSTPDKFAYTTDYLGNDTTIVANYWHPISKMTIDSLLVIVMQHWDPIRYVTWLSAADTLSNFELSRSNAETFFSMLYYSWFIDDKSNGDITSRELFLNRCKETGIPKIKDISYHDMFLALLLSDSLQIFSSQGWDDCSWRPDTVSRKYSDPSSPQMPFGFSPTALELKKRITGRYFYKKANDKSQ